jgi:uncharacterized protein (UPF0332 family)
MEHRTAAARAYYAVMHLVRAELHLDPANSTHAGIRAAMLSIPVDATPPHFRRAKAAWDQLKEKRRRADYLVDDPFPLREAEASVRTAREIFNLRP